MADIRRHFLTGILTVTPVAVTCWITWKVYLLIDGFIRPLLEQIPFLRDNVPSFVNTVAGVIVSAILIVLIGVSAKNLLGAAFFRTFDRLMDKIPVVRGIFHISKQISEVLLSNSNSAFQKVAMFDYPRSGIKALGFVTSDDPDKANINVFLPTTPNPTSGFMLILPRADVQILDMSVEEGIRLIISGGSVVENSYADIIEQAIAGSKQTGESND
ncbi:MAG: DUF502 domain-containing protein [bacterium]|nr:DUF502 domain-containing protein [bacterium]MCP4799377.1 DUF502 domain-containing protein [bacterium]